MGVDRREWFEFTVPLLGLRLAFEDEYHLVVWDSNRGDQPIVAPIRLAMLVHSLT